MKISENIGIPLIAGTVLLLGSFVPIVQIMLLYGCGAFLYPFREILDGPGDKHLNIILLFFAVVSLVGYYFAKGIGLKILWVVLTIFFLNGFIFFLEMEFTNGGNNTPFFVGFMITAVLTVAPIFFVGLMKDKKLVLKK